MRSSRKALLALVLLAPVLTEVATGNTPLRAYLDSRVLLFLTLAYSFPAAVIRELAVRRRLSVAGVFLLGLAYGIWNEGLLAQTLVRAEHVPIDRFDQYMFTGGFNWAWICLIVPWHALFAVLFPLALVHHWWPDSAGTPWFGRRTFVALASLLAAAVLFLSLVRTPHPQMRACLVAIGLLVLLALGRHDSLAPPAAGPPRVLPAFAFGALSYVVIFVTLILLAGHAPPALYLVAVALLFSGFALLTRRRALLRPPKVALVALGGYFAVAAFHVLAAAGKHSPLEIFVGLVLSVAFAVLAMREAMHKRIPNAAGASLP